MPALREWQLFIDETGDFSDPAASVSVVGWLVQHRQNPDFDHSLRSGLSFVLPDAAWPPHASVLNLSVTQAVIYRLFGHAKTEDKRWLRAAPDVWRELSAVDNEAVREVVRLAESGSLAPYNALRAADAALPSVAPRLFRRLRAQRGARAERMATFLECVRDCFGSGESWLVGASVGPVVDEAPTSGDRYLDLLESLFVRVFALLRSDEKVVNEVRTFVARRHVHSDVVGKPITLRIQDVGACVRRAESFPLLAPQEGKTDIRVRIVAHDVARYDELVRPGIVLADFAANRLRWSLATAPTWSELRAQARARIGLPVEAPPRMAPTLSLPAMAAQGASAKVIVDAFSRAGQVEVPHTSPGWTVNQAKQWVDVAARWT